VSRAPTVSRRKPLYEGGSGRGRREEKETKGGTALNNVPLALFAFYEAQFRLEISLRAITSIFRREENRKEEKREKLRGEGGR